MRWFCHIGGQQYGPVEEEVIRQWLDEGRVNAETLIWTEGMEQWQRCDQTQPFAATFGTAIEKPSGTGGHTPNKDIMAKARGILAGEWGKMALYTLGYLLTLGVLSSLYYQYIYYSDGEQKVIKINYGSFIFGGVSTLGITMLYLALIRSQKFSFATYFKGFRNFGRAFLLYLLMFVLILLWTLLLIIPGIIAAYKYSMAFYILADNPKISPLEAIRQSKEMMDGHKAKLFFLGLRFIGWFILAAIPSIIIMDAMNINRYNSSLLHIILCWLPYYIAMLFIQPYFWSSMTLFYQDILPSAAKPNAIAESEPAEDLTAQEPE